MHVGEFPSECPDVPIVVMTGFGDIDLAVPAMRRGAQSVVQKPWDNLALAPLRQLLRTALIEALRQD